MAFEIKGTGGNSFYYPSAEAYQAAYDWHNRSTQAEMVEYYARNIGGGALWKDKDRTILVDDWHHVIMEKWAMINFGG